MAKVKHDQYFTNPKVALDVVHKALKVLEEHKIKFNNFLEPSAGSGNFIYAMKNHFKRMPYKAFDIDLKPNPYRIEKRDFLKDVKPKYNSKTLIIGNPPFGNRAKLALYFLNNSLKWGSTVVFILPKQFERFLTQKQVIKEAKLIFSEPLRKDSFLVNDQPYDVNCIMQIWTIKKNIKTNQRILQPKPKIHEDFETIIHNNTQGTLKYFDKKVFAWDIALHRQGYYKYNTIIKNPDELVTNRQYLFVKFKNKIAEKVIKKIDLQKLSTKNTSTPGFSTTDFVEEYIKIKKRVKGE